MSDRILDVPPEIEQPRDGGGETSEGATEETGTACPS